MSEHGHGHAANILAILREVNLQEKKEKTKLEAPVPDEPKIYVDPRKGAVYGEILGGEAVYNDRGVKVILYDDLGVVAADDPRVDNRDFWATYGRHPADEEWARNRMPR